MSETPTSEVAETMSLADLFAADPLSLTREDRKPMIEYYRSRRHIFLSGGKAPKEPKVTKSKGPLPDIDLGDLQL